MSTCYRCGDQIEFRYVDGRLVPIHQSGGWCTGSRQDVDRPFRTTDQYVNPNATCPVCGVRVFFFQSRYGGRVFFNELGWPWPKHGCTDNSIAQSRAVQPLAPKRSPVGFRNKYGEALHIYELVDIRQVGDRVRVQFKRLLDNQHVWASISGKALVNNDITIADFRDAPSFIARKQEADVRYFRIEFICARRKRILRIKLRRD